MPDPDLRALYELALDVAPSQREAFVRENAANPQLADRVIAMLNLEEESTLDEGVRSQQGEAGLPEVERYQPIRILGEGGFGTVFLAQQTQPIRRKIALKVIRPDLASSSVLARFEAERQSLALMDHPGIARIYDAGTTQDGRPYFAMEYVDGGPITEYCEKRQLGLRERIDLMCQVCSAVQHAHSKGLVHRDLKPGNILVADTPDGPAVKVIDFGISKALEPDLANRAVVTVAGQLIGTPLYMAPEQAAGDVASVDTRTDVYLLGVILYRLLTGVLPFDADLFKSVAVHEWARILNEVTPSRPSARLVEVSESTAERSASQSTSRTTRALKNDLDWVVMKCLDKPRDRRYQSPNELAEDLRRYLRGDPVEAGPPTATYRLRKLATRYRGAAIATGLVVLSLVGAVVVSTMFAISENRQRRIAAENESTAIEYADFLNDDLLLSASPYTDGPDLKVVTVIERALQSLEESFVNRPWLRSRMRVTLGEALLALGELSRAQDQLRLGLEGPQEIHAPPGRRIEAMLLLAEALWRQGNTNSALVEIDNAMALFDESKDLPPEVRSNILNARANALKHAGQDREADSLYAEVINERTEILGENHALTLQARFNKALLYMKRGLAAQGAGDEDIAQREFAAGLAAMTAIKDAVEQTLGQRHPQYLSAESERIALLRKMGLIDAAIDAYELLIPEMRAVLGDKHWRMLDTLANYGFAVQLAAEESKEEAQHAHLYQRAVELYTEAVAGYRERRGPDHQYTVLVGQWQAAVHRQLGQDEAAASILKELFEAVEANPSRLNTAKVLAEKIAEIYDDTGSIASRDLWLERAAALKAQSDNGD